MGQTPAIGTYSELGLVPLAFVLVEHRTFVHTDRYHEVLAIRDPFLIVLEAIRIHLASELHERRKAATTRPRTAATRQQHFLSRSLSLNQPNERTSSLLLSCCLLWSRSFIRSFIRVLFILRPSTPHSHLNLTRHPFVGRGCGVWTHCLVFLPSPTSQPARERGLISSTLPQDGTPHPPRRSPQCCCCFFISSSHHHCTSTPPHRHNPNHPSHSLSLSLILVIEAAIEHHSREEEKKLTVTRATGQLEQRLQEARHPSSMHDRQRRDRSSVDLV